jgi:3-hexulose-6-phosphate synthase
MKLFISFNQPNLSDAISCAQIVEDSCDAFAIGPVLLIKNGIRALETFKKRFPQKEILCDCRIADHENDITKIVSAAGSDWATVIAQTHPHIIKAACGHARSLDLKIMLDLIGNTGTGQYALDAKELGVDAVLFHLLSTNGTEDTLAERWDLVKNNTPLPVFIATGITKQNINDVMRLEPDGIFVGGAIIESSDPKTEADYFYRVSRPTGKKG